MNLLDLGIIVLLGLITVRGFFRGLFQEVAVLVGVVLPRDSHLLKGSVAAPHLIALSHQALGLLPPDFKQRLNDYLKEWRRPREVRQAEASRPQADQEPQAPAGPRRKLGKGPRD